MKPTTLSSPRSLLLVALAVGVAYYAGAQIGLALTIPPAPTSVLWPPNAILSAALLLVSPRHWWVCLAAALPVHMLLELRAGFPPLLVGALFVTNCSEAIIAATGMRLWSDAPLRFDTFSRVAAFIGCVALAAPILSSFADAAVIHWFDVQPYWLVWRTRTFANVLTELSIVPPIVAAFAAGRRPSWRRIVEATCLAAGLTGTAAWIFGERSTLMPMPGMPPTPSILMLPFLVWAAVRFGVAGISTALLLVVAVVSYETRIGHPPFAPMAPSDSLIAVQLYLAAIAMPLMCVAGLLDERRRGAASLAERLRFESAVSAIAASCVRFPAGADRDALEACLRPVGEFLRCDYVGLFELDARGMLVVSGAWQAVSAGPFADLELPRTFPDACARVLSNETIVWDGIADAAQTDSEHLRRRGIGSAVMLPLQSGASVQGALTIVSLSPQTWTAARLTQVTVMAEVLANACARRRSDWALQRARQELAHVSRVSSMGELTASLAHQLNQPLAGILSNAQAARRMIEAGRSRVDEFGDVIDDIIADDLRAADVIRRVRDMLTPGETSVMTLDVNMLIDDVTKLIASDALLRNVSIAFRLAPEAMAVTANRVDLEQVLLNVLTNAIDAVAAGPARGRVVTVNTARVNGDIRILVRDQGPGLPPGFEDRVFEPFFSTKKSGMGMGLAVARSLVEQAGGSIAAANQSTGGAVITVTLPGAAR